MYAVQHGDSLGTDWLTCCDCSVCSVAGWHVDAVFPYSVRVAVLEGDAAASLICCKVPAFSSHVLAKTCLLKAVRDALVGQAVERVESSEVGTRTQREDSWCHMRGPQRPWDPSIHGIPHEAQRDLKLCKVQSLPWPADQAAIPMARG